MKKTILSSSFAEKPDKSRVSRAASVENESDQALFNKNILDLLMRMGKQMEAQQKNVREIKGKLSTLRTNQDTDSSTINIEQSFSESIRLHENALQTLKDSMQEVENKISLMHKKQERANKDIEQALKINGRLISQIERIEQTMLRLSDPNSASAPSMQNNIFIKELIHNTTSPKAAHKSDKKILEDIPAQEERGIPPFSKWEEQKAAANSNDFTSPKRTKFTLLRVIFHPLVIAGLLLGCMAFGFGWEYVSKTRPSSQETSQEPSQEPMGIAPQTKVETPEIPAPQDLNAIAKELNKLEPSTQAAPAAEPMKNIVEQNDLTSDPTLPSEVKALEEKALQGSAAAQYDLGALYVQGKENIPINYARALHWFEKAAAQNMVNAQYNLGVLYQQGLGVPASPQKAVIWYEKAALSGHPEAQYNLGMAFIEGVGVAYAPEKAAVFFKKAALSTQSVIPEASYNYGLLLENRLIETANPTEALRWYKKAALEGSDRAKAAFQQLAQYLNVDPETVKPYQAAETSALIKEEEKADQTTQKPVSITETKAENKADAMRRQLYQQTQIELKRLGLYPGDTDGTPNSLFRDAVKSYQRMTGKKESGWTSAELVSDLRKQKIVHN